MIITIVYSDNWLTCQSRKKKLLLLSESGTTIVSKAPTASDLSRWVVPEIAYTGTQRGRISRKEVYKFDRENWHSGVIIHCQIPRETVLFSRGFSPDVSRDEVEENISNRGKTAVNSFPEEPDIISHKVSVVLFLDFHFNSDKKITGANQNSRLASVLY